MNQAVLEFKEELVKKLEEAVGTEARISFVLREGNNGLKEQVLVLGRKGCRHTVSFRLTGFYEGCCENKDFLDAAAAAILKQFEEATRIGEINRDVRQSFVGGSIRMETVGEDKVRVTDRTGEHMTLTMNLYCDIMDADTGQLYAKSDLPHDILRIGTKMSATWEELPR